MDGCEPNDECVPEIGCLVNGLFLDGAAWCHAKNHLVEPKNGCLFNEMATVSMHTTANAHTHTVGLSLLLVLGARVLLLLLIGLLHFNSSGAKVQCKLSE